MCFGYPVEGLILTVKRGAEGHGKGEFNQATAVATSPTGLPRLPPGSIFARGIHRFEKLKKVPCTLNFATFGGVQSRSESEEEGASARPPLALGVGESGAHDSVRVHVVTEKVT